MSFPNRAVLKHPTPGSFMILSPPGPIGEYPRPFAIEESQFDLLQLPDVTQSDNHSNLLFPDDPDLPSARSMTPRIEMGEVSGYVVRPLCPVEGAGSNRFCSW